MSEVRLNLTDSEQTISGTIHASVADRAVAALSAEPETIAELQAALARFEKRTANTGPFAWFRSGAIDNRPWDAGIVIIDLAARIVAFESTYSQYGPRGCVWYHDGESATDLPLPYWLSPDWIFCNSIEGYEGSWEARRAERQATPPLDAREVLYGRPLLEFIARECSQSDAVELTDEAVAAEISAAHARWLMTSRDDLRGQSPREVLLGRQELINYDLEMRDRQWSIQGAAPPVLSKDSFAYRFAGFGIHEWVIYYELVRHLFGGLWSVKCPRNVSKPDGSLDLEAVSSHPEGWLDLEAVITHLEHLKTTWLNEPQPEFSRIPAEFIESERKRLPIAATAIEVLIDEDCYTCQMESRDVESGRDVVFIHLDGCNMDDEFAFSHFLSYEAWQADRREWEKVLERE